jgi:hypothetical protein
MLIFSIYLAKCLDQFLSRNNNFSEVKQQIIGPFKDFTTNNIYYSKCAVCVNLQETTF